MPYTGCMSPRRKFSQADTNVTDALMSLNPRFYTSCMHWNAMELFKPVHATSKDAFKQHKLPELLDCELCKRRGEVPPFKGNIFSVNIHCLQCFHVSKASTLSSKCEHSFHIITHRTGRPKVVVVVIFSNPKEIFHPRLKPGPNFLLSSRFVIIVGLSLRTTRT